MNFKNFSISRSEGKLFSKLSGDTNNIHLDKNTGYNSIYGDNIIHGCYLIIRFLKGKNIKEFQNIKFNFRDGFFYNRIIKSKKIIKKNSNNYNLIQDNKIKADIYLNNKHKENESNHYKRITFKKKFLIKKENKEKFKDFNSSLDMALCYLSRYVGMYYPGKNSLITEIDIHKTDKILSQNNYINISSFRVDDRFPIIINILTYKSYKIFFKTAIRPTLNLKFNKLNKKTLEDVNKINKNIFIIGASSGIGLDMLNIFKHNKKKKIIATYFRNKIKIKKKNLIKIKINIFSDFKEIKKIIKKYSPMIIYYFATSKININTNDKYQSKIYKKYFITIPVKIVNYSKKLNNCFFYPSTKFIDDKNKSSYSMIKLKAENILKKFNKKEIFINIERIPEINTKQNLKLIDSKLPNFSNLILKSKKMKKKVFFN
mgnify:CR=1 FL=1